MKVLRFYHLGLLQMHELDGNSSEHGQLRDEVEQHKARMQAQGLDSDQPRFDPQWLETLKLASR